MFVGFLYFVPRTFVEFSLFDVNQKPLSLCLFITLKRMIREHRRKLVENKLRLPCQWMEIKPYNFYVQSIFQSAFFFRLPLDSGTKIRSISNFFFRAAKYINQSSVQPESNWFQRYKESAWKKYPLSIVSEKSASADEIVCKSYLMFSQAKYVIKCSNAFNAHSKHNEQEKNKKKSICG